MPALSVKQLIPLVAKAENSMSTTATTVKKYANYCVVNAIVQ